MAIGSEGDLLNGPQVIPHPASVAMGPAVGRPDVLGARVAGRLVVTDALVLGGLAAAFSSIATAIGGPDFGAAAVLLGLMTVVGFATSSLYATVQRPSPSPYEESWRVALAVLLAVVGWAALATVVFGQTIDRPAALALVAWALAAFALTLVTRRSVRMRALRVTPQRVLIVGAGSGAQALARQIAGSGEPIEVVGFVQDGPASLDHSLESIPVFEELRDLTDIVAATNASRLVIASREGSSSELLETLQTARLDTMPISVTPRLHELTPPQLTPSELAGAPTFDLYSARLSKGARRTKRAIDLTLAGAGLLVLAPLGLAIAAAIKLTSPGPVFFGQLRTGQHGRVFRIWKFRTMVKNAEDQRMELAGLNDMERSGPLFKIRQDPRVTPVGRALRRLSLDELPQLFNVLAGTMSLVGPRPFVCHEADQMNGWCARRLDVPPGITGLWQVRGRNDVPYEEMIRLDLIYVANWSPWWDLRLLLETIPRVVSGRGAS